MAGKPKAAKAEKPKTAKPKVESGFDKLAEPETREDAVPASNDIDDRMAALLKDQQAMGARPLKEPVTVDKAG